MADFQFQFHFAPMTIHPQTQYDHHGQAIYTVNQVRDVNGRVVFTYGNPIPYTPYDDNQNNNNGTVFGQLPPDNRDIIRAEHDAFYDQFVDNEVQVVNSIRAHESSDDPFFDYSFDDQFDEYESFYGQFADMGSTMTEGDGLSEETITKHLKTSNYPTKGGELCAVCLDGLAESDKKTRIGSLDCGHEYHEACIKQWLTRKNFCPLCKAIGIRM